MFNNIKNILSRIIYYFREKNKINDSPFSITSIPSIISSLTINSIYTQIQNGIFSLYSNNNISQINRSIFVYCLTSQYSFTNCLSIGDSSFTSCKSLTFIDLLNCTSIGKDAFASCTSLSSISIPVCKQLGYAAFRKCNSLKSIDLPSCTYIGSYAFLDCTALTDLSAPKCLLIGTSAFQQCKFKALNFPVCSTLDSYVFQHCSNLSFINLPNCTRISDYAFHYCIRLLSLYLPGSLVCTLTQDNAFANTPISNYIQQVSHPGSIFVPSSLLDTYQSATNWAVYSSRFATIEDNPLPSEFTS